MTRAEIPCLLIEGIEPEVWCYALKAGSHKIGRSPLCEVRILHTSVSRLHAEIRAGDGSPVIRDLNSQNGTFINGRRIRESPLAIDDTLRLGTLVLHVAARTMRDQIAEDSTEQHALSGAGPDAGIIELCSRYGLSQAQGNVLCLLLRGLMEKEVAAELHLSRHTVHTHAKCIYRALGVHSRPELLACCSQHQPRVRWKRTNR